MERFRVQFMPAIEKSSSLVFESEEYESHSEAKTALCAVADIVLFLGDQGVMKDYSNSGWIEKFEDNEWCEVVTDED